MKFLLNRFFDRKFKKNNNNTTKIELPSPIPINNLFEAQKRSFIGIVARQMAEQLNFDPLTQDAMVYLPFAVPSFHGIKDNEAEFLLFLSERMVSWIKEKEDVYLRIREMKLPGQYLESFLKVYEDVKEQMQAIFHPNPSEHKRRTSPEEGDIWEVYRDVMFAVTQRKFLLIRKHEVSKYKEGQALCQVLIKERSDIPKSREIAKENLLKIGFNHTQVTRFLLAISEAITNILKHAKEGSMTLIQNGQKVYVIVEDKGPGFDLKLLPNTTLMAGYSTKKSLGQGFMLMMKMAEQVMLATNSEGSVVILLFEKKESGFIDEEHSS